MLRGPGEPYQYSKKSNQILYMLESFPPPHDASQMSYMILSPFLKFSAGSLLIIYI